MDVAILLAIVRARARDCAERALEPAKARYVLGRSVMMNRTIPSIAFAFVLLAACDHQDSSGTTAARTTSGTQLAAPVDAHAIDAIAGARCDREQTCNNVGVDKTYATRDVCIQRLRADDQNDLTNASCPNGISRVALDKCLGDVRGERCDHPLDTLSRLSSCSKSSLCP
jgi:hypothetical protein